MNYIREQSIGEILRVTFSIYFKNFWTMFISVLLVMLPISIFAGIIEPNPIDLDSSKAVTTVLRMIGQALSFLGGLLVYAALTVIISEICLGFKPSLGRAYKRVFGKILGKLLATNFLQMLAIFIGSILLFIPGIIAFIWFVFCQQVVVLEGIWGVKALKRSKALGKGNFWRILGLIGILFCVILFPSLIIMFFSGFLVGFLFSMIGLSGMTLVLQLLAALFNSLLLPIGLIPFVLLYYDLRVRKEGFDNTALAEDLKH